MQQLVSESILINREAEEVFDYLSNMENFKSWFQGVVAIESQDETSHGQVGKVYLETVKVPLRGERKIQLLVVESVRPHKFVTEGMFPPLLPRMEVLIEAQGKSSAVQWSMYSRSESWLFKLLVLPFAKSVISKRAKQSLGVLKSKLDHTA